MLRIFEMLKTLYNFFFRKSKIKVNSIKNRLNLPENIELVKLGYFAYIEHTNDPNFLTIELITPDCVNKEQLIKALHKSKLFSVKGYSVEQKDLIHFDDDNLAQSGNLYIDLDLKFSYKGEIDIKNKFLNYFGIKYEKFI